MIGYYVHHQGLGHLHRAQALAEACDEPVTGLSSLPRPATWEGPWRELPRDDQARERRDVTANSQLHWAPLHEPGLRQRTTAVSTWIEEARPRLIVADVSVEITLLARLHGIPVVSVVLPGRRSDAAHLLGFRASSGLVAMWPPDAADMTPGLPVDVRERISCVGAVSRLEVGAPAPSGGRRVVVLNGRGGAAMTRRSPEELARLAPGWEWTVLGGAGPWAEDIGPVLRAADVVVTQAGQSSLADVAACRRPAIVVPAPRPHEEQVTTAAVLASGRWPALVLPEFPQSGWVEVLERSAAMDGRDWESWCDGLAARRFAAALSAVDATGERRTA